MNLSLYEQETIINYNEADSTASVYTHNRALIRRLDKFAQERPGDCHREKRAMTGKQLTSPSLKAGFGFTRRVQLEKHSGRRWKRHEMP